MIVYDYTWLYICSWDFLCLLVLCHLYVFAWIFCLGLDPYKMARLFLSKKNVDKIFPKFAQARGGWEQPFCRAFELQCHFVVMQKAIL